MKIDRGMRETVFAEQYLKFKRCNMKSNEAFEKIKKMGYDKTQRSMDRHAASVRKTGSALSAVKKDCSHRSLNDEQMAKVDAWI